ncbi:MULTISPECIES: hypothetical protein [unclassified Bacillus (in: firmicutes)]|uniref:hypothetical protein n=1 Tax=unclassified Bacillus (in: firmicutes) TaxID=185979 RepID=UPI0008DED923|nr:MULTISPECIES: hypothetical protein [unclassified Bacillus (in: firmicutes)]SFA96145.1 hypothetical protein SAMN02799634_103144 [Bacillus sp. UNCCL13]SFQ79618.1 hypothetical protein SAMN04488577_1777 [Bacillus sp. cl95]
MELIMFILLGISILLIVLSFFQKDPLKELKDEIDQFTIQQVQDLYQIKKKMKVLEEELLVNEVELPKSVYNSEKKEIHDIIKNQVIALSQQGKAIDQIAAQSSLSMEDVYGILRESKERGTRHE